MLKIAIVGSCITRDLWPIRGGGAEHLLYISRTSLASLFAPPVAGFKASRKLPGDLHAHEHAALVADLTKTALGRLIAFQPTHIIFDFIDERFDLIGVGPSLAVRSAELERSGYLGQSNFQNARPIARRSAACERLWTDAAGAFAALVRGTELSRAVLVLHAAQWATEQRLADGSLAAIRDVEITTGRPADIGAYNGLLERQEAVFRERMPPMLMLDASSMRLADPAHQWGLSPFHYVADYYDEVRRQMADLGLGAAFSGASDARPSSDVPSVRAA